MKFNDGKLVAPKNGQGEVMIYPPEVKLKTMNGRSGSNPGKSDKSS